MSITIPRKKNGLHRFNTNCPLTSHGLLSQIKPLINIPLIIQLQSSGFQASESSISWLTTFGSARVLVSPSSSSCLEAIFLRILLIIFPLLVFGSAGAQWILSGAANAPIWNVHKRRWKISDKWSHTNWSEIHDQCGHPKSAWLSLCLEFDRFPRWRKEWFGKSY